MSILLHPHKPYLFIGIQRGGTLNGKSYQGGNRFLAVYGLAQHKYIKSIYLAEIRDNRSDDGTPISLLYDQAGYIYVGMFQSNKGINIVDEVTFELVSNISFIPNKQSIFSVG